jgi:DNA-directed RNA polymerase subunit RPC12/RpoP
MLIVFSCANCGKKFEKDEGLAGKKGRCKDCGHVFVIPTLSRMASSTTARAPDRVVGAGDNGRPTAAQRPQPLSTWPDSNRQKLRSAPSPAAPIYAEAIDDPFGLDNVPAALPEPAQESTAFEDEELALPRRIAPISSKSKKGR